MYFGCDKLFLYILVFTQAIFAREVPDLTFVIRNVSSKMEPICIADKNILDSAISWSYPIEDVKDRLPTIVSKYIPELDNDYSCDFLKTKHCSTLWQMEDWQFSKFDSHNFKPTLDARWENLPTLLTSSLTKEFKNRVDIPHAFELGLSIRAAGNAEIFLCTGWDPHSYPCYYISIGGNDTEQAFLRKYKAIPEKFGKDDKKLDKYTSDERILSESEWRNFVVGLSGNGTVTLVEMFKNVTLLNYADTKALQPIYLFIRSRDTNALWKINSNYYIFTNKSKLTQLGPTFAIYGNTLCVSLFVSMCRYCKMSFYIMINDEKQIIKTVFNENDYDDLLWKQIKLLQHDISEDKIKLFVETKYINNTAVPDGFWGIDDVRVCSEDEIKVTRLVSTMDWKGIDVSHISCQALDVPSWRPIQLNFVNNKDEIEYTSTSTSIQVSRILATKNEHHMQQHYVIQYEGKDICNRPGTLLQSKSRLKSQGFVIVHSTQTIIKDLIPYTTYNITFWNVVDDIKMWRDVSTLPTEIPNTLELPRNVAILVTSTTCDIRWDAPNCNETFGPIMYQVKVYIKNGTLASTQADVTTIYNFKNLQPSSDYEVEIRTARRLEHLSDLNLSVSVLHNFTTYSNDFPVQPAVKNLEIYATNKNSAQLRFDLSVTEKSHFIQLRSCHPYLFGKCSTDMKEIKECKLWKQKFCIAIDNLTSGAAYTFFVSLKNNATNSNGKETNVTAVISEKVPGMPANVTYKMRNCVTTVDCCHLNISWAHPFNQSGSIMMFDIVLTEFSYTYVLDSFKSIHEVLKVTEESYKPVYTYNIKYISCSVPYKISVRSVNDHYKGQFASTIVTAKSTMGYVDPMPTYVNSTNETVIFKLPQLGSGFEGSSLIIVVQDYDKSKTNISEEINNLEIFSDINELCNQFGETWIAKSIQLNGTVPPLIVVGDETTSYVTQLNKTVVNKRLTPDTEYCFTFTIIKKMKESEHVIVYHDKNLYTEKNYSASLFQNDAVSEKSVATYLVPVLLITFLVSCGAWLSYRFLKKKRQSTGGEHIYESMPFDDYLTDAVSNDSYDRLTHD